jgi:hypothetical protein
LTSRQRAGEAMKVTLMKALSRVGKAIMFIVIVICLVLLFAERMHETFFDPALNFIRSLI